MSGIVERALIDREFVTEKNQRLLAVYIHTSKPFFFWAEQREKRDTSATGVALPLYASRFALVPHSSRLCLAFWACLVLSPWVSRFALVSRASPRVSRVSHLCFALPPCVLRFALAVSRFPLVSRVSRLCLTLYACFSRFARVSRVSPLCLTPRDCASRSPH